MTSDTLIIHRVSSGSQLFKTGADLASQPRKAPMMQASNTSYSHVWKIHSIKLSLSTRSPMARSLHKIKPRKMNGSAALKCQSREGDKTA